ncbi:hypothetical protein ABIA54_004574 [Pseudomonas sp. EB276 TE3739]|uniref:hypothetical protein n=1 Tax=Pseudomonas TaxID=286 RepID=UPI00209C9DB9|nr:hypothetical protein [Pseudomonas koreensis]MCP1476580.1 hypothetical protein [Pseudomonas koreensis]
MKYEYLVRKKILGGDFFICQDEFGGWRLDGASPSFNLVEDSEFKRVISLLELPFSEVKLELGSDFPYFALIGVGLKHESDCWIDLALNWVSQLNSKEALEFFEELKFMSADKKISQRNRGLAKKEIKRLRGL